MPCLGSAPALENCQKFMINTANILFQLDDGRGSPLATAYQGPATGYLAEGLSPGRPYQCRVCACSEGGQGAWSSLSQFQTPPTLPRAPRALRLWSRPTQTSVTLEWGTCESASPAARMMPILLLEWCQSCC